MKEIGPRGSIYIFLKKFHKIKTKSEEALGALFFKLSFVGNNSSVWKILVCFDDVYFNNTQFSI